MPRRGLALVEWPQSETRMTVCSENLHRLIVEQHLRHPGGCLRVVCVAERDARAGAGLAPSACHLMVAR